MLELAALCATAAAAPSLVVVFDNGADDAAFYRRAGGPSIAEQLVTAVAVAGGEHPRVFTVHARGDVPGGGVHEVAPLRPGCVAPGSSATDRCWCAPGEDCWGALGASAVAGEPDALSVHANAVRGLVPEGPRLELHVTDLFPTPGPGEDPCVTEGTVNRELQALANDPAPLDHVAVGLLRASFAPDPAGPPALSTFSRSGRCLVAGPAAWPADGSPLDANLALLVLGYGTGGADGAVTALVDAVAQTFDGGGRRFELARLRAPVRHLAISTTTPAAAAHAVALFPSGRLPALPCGSVRAFPTFVAGSGAPVAVLGAEGACNGTASLTFSPEALRAAFLEHAGLDPRIQTLPLRGELVLRGDEEALRDRFLALSGAAAKGRGLPTLPGLLRLVFPADGGGVRARPWETRVHVEPLVVTDLDPRPWAGVIFGAAAIGAIAGVGCAGLTHRVHASWAMRRHWAASLAEAADPLLQKPIAAVLGAAQVEVARAWPLRVAFSALVGTTSAALGAVGILLAWQVVLG